MEVETAVIDSPAVDTTPAAEPVTPPTEPGAELEPAGQPAKEPTEQEKLDRRQNPDALRKTLKWLRENGGEHSAQAQIIERMLGEIKSYKSVAPTVREAREIKQAVDAVGGVAKIAELQQSNTRYQQIDGLLEAGDKSVIPMIFEMGAKGIGKLLPDIIDELGKTDAASVATAIRPHAMKFMESEGLTDAIDAMVGHFNDKEPDKAKDILARIVQWYRGQAQNAPAAKADPDREAFEKERSDFHQKRYEGDVKSAFDQVISHADTVLGKQLAGEVKRLGLSPESAQLLKEDAWKKLEKLRNADAIFGASKSTKFNDKARTVAADAAAFVNGYTDRLAKEACDWAVRMRYGHIKGAVQPAAPAGQPVKENPTAPPITTIALDQDMTSRKLGRAGAMDAIMSGKGFTRDGKAIVKIGKIWKLA